MRTKKMRLVSMILALAMLFAIAPTSAFAAPGLTPVTPEYTDDSNQFNFTVDENDNATIIAYVGDENTLEENDHVVTIPEKVKSDEDDGKEYSVTAIGDYAFNGWDYVGYDETWGDPDDPFVVPDGYQYNEQCGYIQEIDIEAKLTSIGNYAFEGCEQLSSVNIPQTVTFISSHAFENCSALEELELPNGITEIADYTFSGCGGLHGIDIPNSVTAIGEEAFSGCFTDESEVELTLPNSLLSIGAGAFVGSNVNAITIPDSVTSIGESAFAISQLSSVRIPENDELTELAEGIFSNCWNLESISIPKNIATIGAGAFAGAGFTDITIPSNVKVIGAEAFTSCRSLENVVISEGVTEIGDECFSGCYDLRTIEIPTSVTSLGNNLFKYAMDDYSRYVPLEKITYGGSETQWQALLNGKSLGLSNTIVENLKVQLAAWNVAFTTKYGIAPVTVEIKNGETVTKPTAEPVADHYTFGGWYKDEDCTEAFKFANEEGADTITAHTILYAKWIPEEHTVTFHYNDDITPDKTESVKHGEAVKAPEATRKGYKLAGWYTNEEFDGDAFDFESDTITTDTDFYAKWNERATLSSNVESKTFIVDEPTEFAVTITANDDVGCNAVVKWNFDGTELKKLEVRNGTKWYDVTTGWMGFDSLRSSATAPLRATFSKAGTYTVMLQLFESADDVEELVCEYPITVTVKEAEVTPITPEEPDDNTTTVKTAKLTFSDDCVVTADGEKVASGDQVKVGTEVTVNLAENAITSGMKFGSYIIDPIPDDLEVDGTTATFTLTEEGADITLHLDPEDSDDGIDASTVVAGVAVGAGAAVLTYHIGTELYAEQVLGKGVAVPKTRAEVALKAWELAGKPAVELNGEPLSEAAQAEKWAVESGLMQNVDGSFNGAKKMNKLKALRVLDSAKKMGAQ